MQAIVARAEMKPEHPRLSALLEDLSLNRNSKVWGLINARNEVVHGRLPAEALLPYAVGVAEVLGDGAEL